jgi:lysophospholipase L1-like esterase
MVKFMDIGSKFLGPDGTLSRDIMPDLLHPNEKGYQIWADAMEGTLAPMLK